MSGYLSFSAKNPLLSELAERINSAGTGYHHTEWWSEESDWREDKKSYSQLIQEAFDALDEELERLSQKAASKEQP